MVLNLIISIYFKISIVFCVFFILFFMIDTERFKKFVGLNKNEKFDYSDFILMMMVSSVFWPLFLLTIKRNVKTQIKK